MSGILRYRISLKEMNEPTSRRQFIKSALGATAGVQFFGLVTQKAKASELPSRMNLMLIMTDQERPPMWFPAGWEEANLPTMTRLKANGLSFSHAFCSTAMCTPSRISLFTGLFPQQNHSPWTLTEDYAQTPTEPQLDPSLPNLATCLLEAGYDVVYKGKWHLSHGVHGVDGAWIEEDISRYGFSGWEAPDAGGDTRPGNFGGGHAAHDQRFVDSAKTFLQERIQSPTGRPFCLIVSLVNPHDLLAYPGTTPGSDELPSYISGGYDESWLEADPPILPPPTVGEKLFSNHKPTAHAAIKLIMAGGLGPVATPEVQKNYLNFYGNLMKMVDGQIGQLLEVFDDSGPAGTTALNNTLIIRTSDHGENGLCHGGLRQKAFVAYEETIRVPLVWSNPVLYPEGKTTDALVSHVDLLPTICSLAGVPDWQSKGFAGIDYSSIVLDPEAPPVQNYVLFTFDDKYAGSDAASFPNGAVPPPNMLRMIRTKDYKYVRYFDAAGVVPDQQEFYDLRPSGGDFSVTYGLPLETKNLSVWAEVRRALDDEPTLADPAQVLHRTILANQLAELEETRLAPRPYSPSVAPEESSFEIKRWVDPDLGPQAKVQLTFYSRLNTNYQMQKSSDLVTWSDSGPLIPGNSAMLVMEDTVSAEKEFYRIKWSPAST
jgi:choline-sulfatase